MNNDFFWLLVSFGYICTLVLLGFIFYRYLHLGSEKVRKFIHIFTSLWILIVAYKMESPILMLLGPFCFIFINAVFVYGGFGKYLGMGDRKRDNGLIYYPLSIFVLVLLSILGLCQKEHVVAGILVMGFGDGLAAIVGTEFGRHSYKVYSKYKKSLEGSAAMLAVSLSVIMLSTHCNIWVALVVSMVATVLENVTPLGFDNITVPISTALLLEVLCSL